MSDLRSPADDPAKLAPPPPARALTDARGYAIAVAAVAAAMLLMFALYGVVGIERGRVPFIFFFGAVTVSALYG